MGKTDMTRCTVQFMRASLLSLAVLLLLAGTGRADTSAYDLCIEHSPTKAGTVKPNTGTHRFSADAVVTLTADAQPGYEFAYWLGDVDNPKAQSTTVRVNAAKIVVAVFRPASKDRLERNISLGGGGGSSGLAMPTPVDLSAPGWSPSGGGGGGDVKKGAVHVIVTPEPATVLLLGLGGLVIRRKRR